MKKQVKKFINLFPNKKLMDIPTNGAAMTVAEKQTEGEGCIVSVRVCNGHFAERDREAIKKANREAYESIMAHKDLFLFATSFGLSSLEELANSEYKTWYVWIKIKDRAYGGQNRLILTHGHCDSEREAHYVANDYDEFWDVVRRLTDMYERPEDKHEPIILEKTNCMCGSAHKKWEIEVS